ncbi:hypothetical protein BHU72_12030 [Desulfuribacillus stibiiarsenatis]|uniref:Phage tail tape measure protein n=1 Tax=Desulfuribacillus stibiiarsenatis TaxID=1390249 RepID=A0A1E5L800_9FIRM|nr:hypothetical protein [Desulfuribacillus stibiiarsenatis]OEH86256.1 hypothetical protein BHU72_12030 [Desulfuribacillus stibiiarsenatis]
MEIFRLFGSIFIKSDEAEKSLDNIDKKAESTGSKFSGMIGTAAKWGAVLGGAALTGGAAMLALANQTSQTADEIDKMSIRTGLSMNRLQELKYVTGQVGVAFDSVQTSVNKTQMIMNQAIDGSEKAAQTFKQMNVELKNQDGSLRSASDVWEDSIRFLSSMESEAERNALAFDLFGKSASELIPLFDAGVDGMADLSNQAHNLGLVMSDDAIAANVKFADTMDSVKKAAGAVFMNIANAGLPILQKFLEWVLDAMPYIQQVMTVAFDAINGAISRMIEWLDWAKNAFFGFSDDTDSTFSKIKEVIFNAINIVSSFIQERLTWLTEFWEENGETIRAATENVFNFIKAIVEFVMPFIQNYIKAVWTIITAIFDYAIKQILNIIKLFAAIFTGDWQLMTDTLKDMWQNLWDLIAKIIEAAWTLIRRNLGILYTNIRDWFTGLVADAFNWGRNMISGFIDGIMSMIGAVRSAVSSVMDSVSGFLGFNSPAKEGPGRHIETWGENMVAGFIDGINNAIPRLENILPELVTATAGNAGMTNQSFAQTVNIYSPDPLTPSEIARRTRQANRELALEWGR